MMKRFFRLPAALLLIPFCGFLPASMAGDCGPGVSPAVLPGDFASVLFVVSGNQTPGDMKGLNPETIKDDIRSSLNEAGIKSAITGQAEDIRADRFLKVHIYSILLEKQVYFSSVAIIQRQSAGGECVVADHSDMTSNPGNIRPQMKELLQNILKEVR
jgi:hypothetical protein